MNGKLVIKKATSTALCICFAFMTANHCMACQQKPMKDVNILPILSKADKLKEVRAHYLYSLLVKAGAAKWPIGFRSCYGHGRQDDLTLYEMRVLVSRMQPTWSKKQHSNKSNRIFRQLTIVLKE